MDLIDRLAIPGCWLAKPKSFEDSRGQFFEWFQDSTFTANSGSEFKLAQANCSISNKGVIRGIHFAKYPPGQAKYVTCFSGSVFDVLVDLRKGSPTFGKWISIVIDSQDPIVIYIPSGVGHAFMALEDQTTFVYLCDQRYNPENEYDITPFDENIGINWPDGVTAILSDKDKQAAKFEELFDVYPNYADFSMNNYSSDQGK